METPKISAAQLTSDSRSGSRNYEQTSLILVLFFTAAIYIYPYYTTLLDATK